VSVPIALSIAGSDPSGGAGIQADLKTFSALGVYGTSVITAVTAQNTRAVTAVRPLEVDLVVEQLTTLVADVRIDAVKIGMLGTADLVAAVADLLAAHSFPAVVLDPVMVATSGDRLADDRSIDAMRTLLRHASLITPNLPEAAALLEEDLATDVPAMHRQARALAALGASRVLVKGGHLAGPAVDVLWQDGHAEELSASRVGTRNTHGTGCSLSSAITAHRARGAGWLDATRAAKAWLTASLEAADRLEIGSGHGPVHHFHQWW
jgi:hydroxymethylpyrimidine/phosphomethylpyrimidine kinase